MTPITLESIKAEQTKLADLITKFEEQALTNAEFRLPEAVIQLAPGEHYAGLILGKDGEQSYHLVLLPGQADDINWNDATAWAKGQGGELPTRREQSLLFANLKDQFEQKYYWSAETHKEDSAYAWCQLFGHGSQSGGHKSLSRLRARAVRRLPIGE